MSFCFVANKIDSALSKSERGRESNNNIHYTGPIKLCSIKNKREWEENGNTNHIINTN